MLAAVTPGPGAWPPAPGPAASRGGPSPKAMTALCEPSLVLGFRFMAEQLVRVWTMADPGTACVPTQRRRALHRTYMHRARRGPAGHHDGSTRLRKRLRLYRQPAATRSPQHVAHSATRNHCSLVGMHLHCVFGLGSRATAGTARHDLVSLFAQVRDD